MSKMEYVRCNVNLIHRHVLLIFTDVEYIKINNKACQSYRDASSFEDAVEKCLHDSLCKGFEESKFNKFWDFEYELCYCRPGHCKPYLDKTSDFYSAIYDKRG